MYFSAQGKNACLPVIHKPAESGKAADIKWKYTIRVNLFLVVRLFEEQSKLASTFSAQKSSV